MHSLALSFEGMGEVQKALELRKQVLEVRKRILGEEHPDTLKAMFNLAISYSDANEKHNHKCNCYGK